MKVFAYHDGWFSGSFQSYGYGTLAHLKLRYNPCYLTAAEKQIERLRPFKKRS